MGIFSDRDWLVRGGGGLRGNKNKVIVRTETEDRFVQAVKWGQAMGWEWANNFVTDKIRWKQYKEKTCIVFKKSKTRMTYGSYEFYRSGGEAVWAWEEFDRKKLSWAKKALVRQAEKEEFQRRIKEDVRCLII